MFSSSQMHLHKSWGDTKFWVASSHAPYRPTAPLGGLLGTGVGGGCPRVPEGGGGLGVGFCTGGDFGDDDGGPVIAEFAYHGSKPVDPARNVIFSHLTVFQSLATCEVKQASASMHSLHKLSEGNYLPGIELNSRSHGNSSPSPLLLLCRWFPTIKEFHEARDRDQY